MAIPPGRSVDPDGRIVLANRATRKLIGRDAVTGLQWIGLWPGIDRAFLQQVLTSPVALPKEARTEGRDFVCTHVRAPSGKEVFVYGGEVTEEKAAERCD